MSIEAIVKEKDVDELLARLPPGFIRDYVGYASNCTDANKAYHVGVAIALLTQTVPQEMHIEGGQSVYGNFYTLLIGESSNSRKSSAITIGQQMLEELDDTCISYDPGSWESFVDRLESQPQQLLFLPEFGMLLSSTKKGYLEPLKKLMINAYDGKKMSRDTKKKQATKRIAARLSLIGGSTREFLEFDTVPDDWTGGYISRHMMIYAEREREFSRPPGDPDGKKRLAYALHQLYQKKLNLAPRAAVVNEAEPWATPVSPSNGAPVAALTFGMSEEAEAAYKKWHDVWEVERKSMTPVAEIRGAFGRTQMHVQKLALLFAWASGRYNPEMPSMNLIRVEDVDAAVAIVDTLHVQSALALGDRLALTNDVRDYWRVLDVIPSPERVAAGIKPVDIGEISALSGLHSVWRVGNIVGTLVRERRVRMVGGVGDAAVYQQLTDAGRDELLAIRDAKAAEAAAKAESLKDAVVLQFEGHKF